MPLSRSPHSPTRTHSKVVVSLHTMCGAWQVSQGYTGPCTAHRLENGGLKQKEKQTTNMTSPQQTALCLTPSSTTLVVVVIVVVFVVGGGFLLLCPFQHTVNSGRTVLSWSDKLCIIVTWWLGVC